MRAVLAQRVLAVAAAAVLAGVAAVAIGARTRTEAPAARALPEPAAAGAWYEALAGVRTRGLSGTSRCGLRLSPGSLGITHPVLPCNAKLFVALGDKVVLTQVIDRGPVAGGRAFDLTRALAERLGLSGVRVVRWTFARPR